MSANSVDLLIWAEKATLRSGLNTSKTLTLKGARPMKKLGPVSSDSYSR